jgi:hypothetical protein
LQAAQANLLARSPCHCAVDVFASVDDAGQGHHDPDAIDNHKVEPEVQELGTTVALKTCAQQTERQDGSSCARRQQS